MKNQESKPTAPKGKVMTSKTTSANILTGIQALFKCLFQTDKRLDKIEAELQQISKVLTELLKIYKHIDTLEQSFFKEKK